MRLRVWAKAICGLGVLALGFLSQGFVYTVLSDDGLINRCSFISMYLFKYVLDCRFAVDDFGNLLNGF